MEKNHETDHQRKQQQWTSLKVFVTAYQKFIHIFADIIVYWI